MLEHAVGPCRATQHSDRARIAARSGERGRQHAEWRYQPGTGDQHSQATGDLTTVGGQHRRQRRRRDRQTDEIVALEVELGGAQHAQLSG